MSSTEEQLYPMMLPDDEDGFEWHIVNMTKEEVIATLEVNSCKRGVSELILEYNQNLISEFEVGVVKYSDASFEEKLENDVEFRSDFSCVFSLSLLVVSLIVVLISHYLFD